MSSRRRGTRLRLPIRALIAGEEFPVVDISITGCAVLAPGTSIRKSLLALTLIIPLQGGNQYIETWAEIAATSGRGRLGLKFKGLDIDDLACLKQLLEELNR
jgi:PilZ domain